MATIGQPLALPEPGWARYTMSMHDKLTAVYTGTWYTHDDSRDWGGQVTATFDTKATFTFRFYGTKFRFTGRYGVSTYRSDKYKISIDGEPSSYFTERPADSYQILVYERTGLSLGEHVVVITMDEMVGTELFNINAIDIDDTGYIVTTVGTKLRNSVTDMEVGDVIRCEYVATSGSAGTFSNIGSGNKKAFIPAIPSAAPNGSFNFICTEKTSGKGAILVADRAVQHSISWITLNTAGLIEGKGAMSEINDLIPTMTSNTAPIGTVSASSSYNTTTYLPFKAFDDNVATAWLSASTVLTGWLQYKFSTAKTVRRYAITATSGNSEWCANTAKDWTLEGSNNGTNWTVLDTKFSQSGWALGEKRIYACQNTESYLYYRLNITASNSTKYVSVGELELDETIPSTSQLVRSISGGVRSMYPKSVIPTLTSNNTDGYIASASSNLNSTVLYEAYRAFDNLYGTYDCWQSTTTTGWLQLELPASKTFLKYGIIGQPGYATKSPKSWVLEGSNDGSVWTTVDTQSNIIFTDKVGKIFNIQTPGSYKYYKLNVSANNGGSYVAIGELKFFESSIQYDGYSDLLWEGVDAFPAQNEWDKYIVNSTLGKKITAGDDSVWNVKNTVFNWTTDTPSVTIGANTTRVARGSDTTQSIDYMTFIVTTTASASYGYRPVLEFSEDDTILY